jgi:hypothetical protein
MEDHESEVFREERDEIDDILLHQPVLIKGISIFVPSGP